MRGGWPLPFVLGLPATSDPANRVSRAGGLSTSHDSPQSLDDLVADEIARLGRRQAFFSDAFEAVVEPALERKTVVDETHARTA